MNQPTFIHHLPLALGAAGLLFLAGCGKAPEGTASTPAPTPEPFTGEVHEVKMRGTAKGFFYEPEQLTIRRGDKVRFLMVDGGPHNVDFANQKIPGTATALLEKDGLVTGVLLQAPGQAAEIIFTKHYPPGDYHFLCTPHAALGMKGMIRIVL